MRLGRLSSQNLAHVQTELLQEKGSTLRFSDLAGLQISLGELLRQEDPLHVDQFAWGNLSIGVDHEQAELIMKILDSKDVLDTLVSSAPMSMDVSPGLVSESSSSPTRSDQVETTTTFTTTPSLATSGKAEEKPADSDVTASLASLHLDPAPSAFSPPFFPSPSSSSLAPISSPSPSVPALGLPPMFHDFRLPLDPSAKGWGSDGWADLVFTDDPPDRRYHLPRHSGAPTEVPDESMVHLARYDSDATVLATEDAMLTLSRDAERMTPENIHGVLGMMDRHHGTMFRDFILNPEHTEVCARQLHLLASHVSVAHLGHVVAWMVSAEPSEQFQRRVHNPWPTLALAKLLTILTMDATPDVAGLFFRLVWVNAYLSKATAIKVTSMMVQDEPPSIAALFVKTFSVSWSLLHLAELISFLDCTLHWSESYFANFMDRIFAYMTMDPPSSSTAAINEFSADVFQMNAAQVLGSSPHMRIVFLTTLYKTNLALNQMKMEYVADQLHRVTTQMNQAEGGGPLFFLRLEEDVDEGEEENQADENEEEEDFTEQREE